MEIRVLGPVEVWVDDAPVHLARRQQRLILGILAMEANHIVSSDRLIDLVWGSHPPGWPGAVVQTRISELRATFTERVHQIVQHLRARGVEVRYDVYLDEGHLFGKRENQTKARGAAADFLLAHLTTTHGRFKIV